MALDIAVGDALVISAHGNAADGTLVRGLDDVFTYTAAANDGDVDGDVLVLVRLLDAPGGALIDAGRVVVTVDATASGEVLVSCEACVPEEYATRPRSRSRSAST